MIAFGLRDWLISTIAKDDGDQTIITNACEALIKNMSYTLDSYNREIFYQLYKEFCETLIKGIVHKNSTLYSSGYVNRLVSGADVNVVSPLTGMPGTG